MRAASATPNAIKGNAARPTATAAAPAATVRPALTVTTVQPRRESLPTTLAANGNIVAWQEASVGAEANGLRVAELHAQVGDRVKRGQLLASFAAESVQADVALAWLLHQKAVTSPIIGPRTMEQLNGAMRVLNLTLSEDTLKRLDVIFPGPGGPAPESYAW